MNRRRRGVAGAAAGLVVAALLALPWPVRAEDAVLLVGNSFTRHLRQELTALVRSALRDTLVKTRASAGYTLEVHSVSPKTARALRSYPWTTVVLQEQSDGIDTERYPFARTLDADIAAIGARTVFFMTWPDLGDPLEYYDRLRGVPGGDEGYVPIAFELDRALAPIGWAFRAALLEDPSIELWARDGHHASERGQYIAALVLYATIWRESTVGLAPSRKLTPEQSLHDQMLVDAVVLGDPDSWNLDAP